MPTFLGMRLNVSRRVKEDPGKGYLRVVAAPSPLEIVEIESIRLLFEAGQIVIAAGGGGIPVIEQNCYLKGASAVIEKDNIASRLAIDLDAQELVILTGIDSVKTGFGTASESPLPRMNVDRALELAEKGEFGEGTMLPKIEAAVSFLKYKKDGEVLITSLEAIEEALAGKAGTVITN